MELRKGDDDDDETVVDAAFVGNISILVSTAKVNIKSISSLFILLLMLWLFLLLSVLVDDDDGCIKSFKQLRVINGIISFWDDDTAATTTTSSCCNSSCDGDGGIRFISSLLLSLIVFIGIDWLFVTLFLVLDDDDDDNDDNDDDVAVIIDGIFVMNDDFKFICGVGMFVGTMVVVVNTNVDIGSIAIGTDDNKGDSEDFVEEVSSLTLVVLVEGSYSLLLVLLLLKIEWSVKLGILIFL